MSVTKIPTLSFYWSDAFPDLPYEDTNPTYNCLVLRDGEEFIRVDDVRPEEVFRSVLGKLGYAIYDDFNV